MKYAKVAADAFVSRQKVEACVQGTTSLLSHCLGKGENVALVLRDMGVLLIEDRRVQMKFYSDFLERMNGKRIQEGAAFKVSLLVSPPPGQWFPSTACVRPAQGMDSCSGQARARSQPPLAALDSSTTECLGHTEEILSPPRSSIAGSPADGRGGVPGGTHCFPDFRRPCHRLSRVSTLVAIASG